MSHLKVFSWGRKRSNTLRIKQIKKDNSLSLIEAIYQGKKFGIQIPFTDEASIQNAFIAGAP